MEKTERQSLKEDKKSIVVQELSPRSSPKSGGYDYAIAERWLQSLPMFPFSFESKPEWLFQLSIKKVGREIL